MDIKERFYANLEMIREDAKQLDETSIESTITDSNDLRKYKSLRNMADQHMKSASKSKDLKRIHHQKMADQHNDAAHEILSKYKDMKEEAEQLEESKSGSMPINRKLM